MGYVPIPEALTNDNFWGFTTEIIYKYRVRWIEAAAACPVFTCLITYYVEGDRGHLMNVEQHRPHRSYAVRGNVYSFYLPWEEIANKLGSVLEDDEAVVLPHTEATLASLVLFSLRIGDVVDLNRWMPQARLRPHVVLKLLEALVDSKYPFKDIRHAHALKRRFASLLADRYPDPELHLPEDDRKGFIPRLIEKAMREHVRRLPGAKEAGLAQRHATPLVAPEETSVALNDVRPVALFPDRDSYHMVPRDAQEVLALKKHYCLEVATGKRLIEQWKNCLLYTSPSPRDS